ncbi:MOSC domain-containing protein [Natronomonas sp. EA1]|uniref:MOSC domain-containing protein n=1 Tax=Natronomonas sp. EA1 TaxID=3421655 RepID=UPI003EBCC226
MPHLSRIRVYPVKSLDSLDLESAEVLPAGGLSLDREWVMRSGGQAITGKTEQRTHRLRSAYERPATLELREHGTDDGQRFDLETERDDAEAWLADYFGMDVSLDRDARGGFPDDTHAAGPTVIATATLEAVAEWYGGTVEDARRRLRPNLEIGGVEPFWEDRLYADRDSVRGFSIGEATFEGVNPCQRCVVPTRDPDTGAETPGFREQFVQQREETLPEWANEDWFDHYFRLMVNTRVPQETVGSVLDVGDEVEIGSVSPS